ncbi:MAG: hypothetical protein ACJ75J_09475 [Cytophagaceae bacterium]
MKKGCLYILFGFLLLSFGCNKALMNSKREIDVITDSLNTSWDAMIISDDQKIEDIKSLIEEIARTKEANMEELKEVQKLSKVLRSKRYNEHSMDESSKIDAYDMATDSLIHRTFALAKEIPGIENDPAAETLKEKIMDADNNVLI